MAKAPLAGTSSGEISWGHGGTESAEVRPFSVPSVSPWLNLFPLPSAVERIVTAGSGQGHGGGGEVNRR